VRNFELADGHRIREQLLALSDREHVSTYCILEASLPLHRYVSTVQLKRVTDGDRTFWHWQSTFDAPRGREREFADLVGRDVYEGGFAGLRAFLQRRPANAQARGVNGDAMPVRGIAVTRHGPADVLQPFASQAPAPGPGEVRIRHSAIGVNFIDVHVRTGRYPLLTPPAPPGMEAAGTVVDVGPDVAHLVPGDRVAYVGAQPGAYVDVRTVPAAMVVALPSDIDDEAAATLMLKGLTAEYLLHRTHRVTAGETVLVHAAAGGLGSFLCAWAKAIGARVIGTVSTAAKADAARAHGCDVALVAADGRFADAVLAQTGNRGVDVIYDGLGGDAHEENLRALAPLGHWVMHGQSGAPHAAIAASALAAKSLTVSLPVLFHFTAARERYESMAANTFTAFRRGVLAPRPRRFALPDAAQAHRELESRRTTGAIVLIP
jgi:NADPH:quinone reductase-like Zn-dependent oxidoreductase